MRHSRRWVSMTCGGISISGSQHSSVRASCGSSCSAELTPGLDCVAMNRAQLSSVAPTLDLKVLQSKEEDILFDAISGSGTIRLHCAALAFN